MKLETTIRMVARTKIRMLMCIKMKPETTIRMVTRIKIRMLMWIKMKPETTIRKVTRIKIKTPIKMRPGETMTPMQKRQNEG
eukprot:scaffold2207_cov95-Cylindrotheca_fusiformis.AAC.1